MGLISRIKSIFKAKANSAVEKAERADPIGIAKAELREAQEDLAKFESAMKQASAQKLLLEKQIKSKQDASNDWLEKAKIAKGQENMTLAEQCCEKSVEFKEEAEALQATYNVNCQKYDNSLAKFRNEEKKIAKLKVAIKDAEIRFKTSKAMNDLQTSQTAGAGVKSIDRINDMLDIVAEEEALAEAGSELGITEEERLNAEVDKLTSGTKAKSLLESL